MSSNRFAFLQQLGRTLMLPIAVLPIAGILLRLGQPDLLNMPFIAQAGDAVFGNLALIFAIGVAIGFARDGHGASALAGAVGYFVMTAALKTLDDKINMGVLGGIVVGVVAGSLYNRFRDIKLPDWLAFFGGKRFVPIATGLSCLILAVVFGFVWPPIQHGIDAIGQWTISAGSLGVAVYGALNRLLLVTGLHHIINNLAWFVVGDFQSVTQGLVHGDLKRFFAGDPTAGAFMTGFFPIMMFGLPAACLAMYRTARPENRKRVGGMLLSMGLTSFLTGITEPIEFAFIFLAPVLYGIHVVLTGASLAILNMMGVKLGFTFSAGAFDYVLSYGIATKPLLMLPVGIAYFAIYYGVFSYAIRKLNLQTPGREEVATDGVAEVTPLAATTDSRGRKFIEALGGAANVKSVDACATRLRVELHNDKLVKESILPGLGSRGMVRPATGSLQVILGPVADIVADEIRVALET